MSDQDKTRAFCRECGQWTWHEVVATRSREEIEVDDEPPVWADVVYDFLQCRGCECVTTRSTLTCERLYQDTKQVRFYPPSSARRRPAWEGSLPPPIHSLLREVYDALQSGSLRLAVIGNRTLVDMAMLDKVGDAGTFEQKLEALESQGFISTRNREVLAAALEAGNASAHRGHRFQAGEVSRVMDIVENLLQATYLLAPAAEVIKNATPPRKRPAK
jgi:hypothetical protein